MPFNRKDHHNFGEIRPRFKLSSKLSEEDVFKRIELFVKNDNSVSGKKVLDQYYLDIPIQYRHFWSPELRIHVEKSEQNPTQSIIRVMVGPQASVWVSFVLIYAVLCLAGLFGGMYGFVLLTMGKDSAWIWCFPIVLVLLSTVWIIAKFGQKVGRDETLHLVSTLYHAIGVGNAERIDS